jgi:hypothetical protein
MNVQQLSVKVFATASTSIDQEELIPVFHRWIREKRLGDELLLIDVADYRHVPDGPGMMLIADDGHYSMDSGAGGLGLQYARKRDAIGDAPSRLAQAFRSALVACDALEQEPSLAGRISFDVGSVEVGVLSRLVAPNTPESYEAFSAELAPFCASMYGTEAQLSHRDDPHGPLRVIVNVDQPAEIKAFLGNLPGG